MENVVDKICKRFLGISLTGSIYEKRMICMRLIRTITELYNVEALANWDISKVYFISDMFDRCTLLPEEISDFRATEEDIKAYLNNLKNTIN